MRHARVIVQSATEYVIDYFGSAFQDCVSVGALGSYALGTLSHVSDIDYYLVFDAAALRANRGGEGDQGIARLVEALGEQLRRSYPRQPYADRFSVFWTSQQCLTEGSYDVGRWPPYDREAFRWHGKHLAGKVIPKETVPAVPRSTLVVDSARFLTDVVRPKLLAAHLFRRLSSLDGAQLAHLDEATLTKAVLMPIRLLYILLPTNDDQVIASTEAAVASCSKVYHREAWWPLVCMVLEWRKTPRVSAPSLDNVAMGLRTHLANLYVFCLRQYAGAVRQHGAFEEQGRLEAWISELTAS